MSNTEFMIDGDKVTEVEAEKKENTSAEENIDLEVVSDTPEEDRGRTPAPAPEDPTEEELANYSESARKRIKHFTRGYHDERRAKEAAARQAEEAARFAQALIEENKRLKGSLNQGQTVLLDQAKKSNETEIEAAKRKLKEAQDAFDSEAIVSAQEELMAARIKKDRLDNFRVPPLQDDKTNVQTQRSVQQPVKPDAKAEQWAQANPWFGKDEEMTSLALGVHQKLVGKDGVDPSSDSYYTKLDEAIRKRFPDKFESAESGAAGSRRPKSNNVAPASRSTAPKKIVLTESQVALAKRLGISPLEYAREAAKLSGKS